jgi:hypothetical protein
MIRDWLSQPGTAQELRAARIGEKAIRAGLKTRWPKMKPLAEKAFSAFARLLNE